jgi:type I restriction enzyme, R subunit
MSLHKEVHLEEEICEHLAAHGWLHAPGDASNYEKNLALYPADVMAWAQEVQPKAWEALTKAHGANACTVLMNRLHDRIRNEGTLHVLRNGIDVFGVNGGWRWSSSSLRWP